MADLSTDSTSPAVVTTSDPAVESGKTNTIRFSERVKAFFDSLSPSGATVYDTGWRDLAVTSATGVFCQVRRIGKTAFFRAEFHTVTAGTFCTLPTEFRPTQRSQLVAMRYASSTSTSYASLSLPTNGVMLVSIVGAAVTTTPGYTCVASWPVD